LRLAALWGRLKTCAAQFVLFDVTFTYTKTDADTSTPSKSRPQPRSSEMGRIPQAAHELQNRHAIACGPLYLREKPQPLGAAYAAMWGRRRIAVGYTEFNMWTRFLLAFSIATAVRAQQDPMDLLRRVQARIADSLDRLPRYMCTQTIDRTLYEPDAHDGKTACDEGPNPRSTHLTTADRLRLDVAMAAAREMYSWVGESRFNDRDLLDMVHEGAISTGTFAAFLTAIFRSENANFTYDGETTEDGRTLSEFGFRVPYEKSHYYFGEGQHRVVTGYDGTFLVDPKTADLVRLVVRTSQLPAETAACYASTTLDYARVRLKGIDFLLPTASRLRISHTDGGESENRTVFSNCHEFLGESTITFDPPPDAVVSQTRHRAVSQFLTIPPGLRFRVALSQGIDTATAAAGDPIQVKLIAPIQDRSKVLVPVGAPLAARIVRIRQFYGAESSISLEVKLETVDVGGVSMRLTAVPDTGQSFQKTKSGTLQRRVELGTLRGMEDRSAGFVFRDVHQPYLIASGLESMWVTATPPPADSALTPPR
jgi:hypothetical protein